MLTARNEATAAITASPKSSSAENAVKCSEGSTGTIVELNLSSNVASADWNLPDWNATPEPSTNWSFKMLSARQSTRCLETKKAQLQLNIASVIRASQATSVENIDEKLMVLQQKLIQKAQSKESYDEIADEIFRLRELRQKTYINGLLLLFCKNLEMKVTQLSTEEKQTLKEIFSRSKPAKEHRKLRRRNPKL